MRTELLEHLACPSCAGDLELERTDEESEGEIFSGVLACVGCAAKYQILHGVPRLNAAMGGLEEVAQTFGFEWKAHLEEPASGIMISKGPSSSTQAAVRRR